MASRELVVVIDEEGNIKVEAVNFHGRGCKETLAKFNNLGKTTHEVLKDEYYHNNMNVNTLDNKKG